MGRYIFANFKGQVTLLNPTRRFHSDCKRRVELKKAVDCWLCLRVDHDRNRYWNCLQRNKNGVCAL